MIQIRNDDNVVKLLFFIGLLGFALLILANHALAKARASPVQMLDWYAESSQKYIDKDTGIWKTGETATVIDIQTEITFSAVRYRGTNHADYEPATKEDTALLKEIYGKWSWDRRPVLVLIDGAAFAASMNGMPHGTESVKDNGYPGHSCIHFLNSKTHGSGKVDKTHQEAVMEAYKTGASVLENYEPKEGKNE